MYKGTFAYRAALGGDVFEGFAASFVSAFLHAERERQGPFYFLRGLGCMLHDTANQIARNFRGEWVLMCDADHVFSSAVFSEMIEVFESENLDILSGFMQSRQPPYRPILFKTNFDPLSSSQAIRPSLEKVRRYHLIPFDASGLGSLMVRRRVFEAIMEQEWGSGNGPFTFRPKFRPAIATCWPRYKSAGTRFWAERPADFKGDDFWWEDYSFFLRAKALGFKAYCAPWIKFYHVEKRLVTDELIDWSDASVPLPAVGIPGDLQNPL